MSHVLEARIIAARMAADRCRKAEPAPPVLAPSAPPSAPASAPAHAVVKQIDYQGIPVHIDRPAGFVQRGVAPDGSAWERCYHVDYGFIPGTQGGDGDGLDVFVGLHPTAEEAHWVLQKREDGSFDEYKLMLGFLDADSAKAMYLAHIPKRFFGALASTSVAMVKALLGLAPAETFKALADVQRRLVLAAEGGAVDVVPRAISMAWADYRAELDAAAAVLDTSRTLRDAGSPEWRVYQRTMQPTELRPYVPGEDLERVSVSTVDRENGSPREGDMIARNPKNRDDQWLVAHDYFAENFTAEAVKADDPGVEKSVRITKGEPAGGEERYVLGIVLEPETVDAQGDIYSAEEIKSAAWDYMANFRNLGLMHKGLVNGRVRLVESYIAPCDMVVHGSQVRAGTWLMGLHVADDELWGLVKGGQLTGLSMGGFATKRPV